MHLKAAPVSGAGSGSQNQHAGDGKLTQQWKSGFWLTYFCLFGNVNGNLAENKSEKLQLREQYAPFFWQNQERKTALGTSAYEKSQCNEDILACRSVITGVRRGGWMFLIALSSALLPVLISSLWHEGGAVAPPVRPRLRLFLFFPSPSSSPL